MGYIIFVLCVLIGVLSVMSLIKNKERKEYTKMLQIKSVRKTFNETVILQEISLLCERGKNLWNYGT